MKMRNFSGKALALSLGAVLALSACGSAAQSGQSTQAGAGNQSAAASAAENQSAAASAAESKAAETGGQAAGGAQTESSGQASEVRESAAQPESGAETQAAGEKESSAGTEAAAVTKLPQVDMAKWQYNAEDDVYWQVGIAYCENPADEACETMGFFVPGGFFDAKDNGDGTFTCEMNLTRKVGNYTADKAPVIIPVNTPGYSAMAAPTDYDSSFGYGSAADYTKEGMVVAFAGCRGRDHGAPLGVTDLKAAIRYLRYHKDVLPGAAGHVYSAGMSGGGAQSAILGASGDSKLYEPYLEAIGAVSGVSDAVQGSMCWCPITNLDVADEAYEWNLGASRTGLTEEEQKLSDGMAESFAAYINELQLKDGDGKVLTLEKSKEGIWQAGSYYEYLTGVVETSLEHFLEDTEFPYDADAASSKGHGGMGGAGGMGGHDGAGGAEMAAGGNPEGTHSGAAHSGIPEGLDGGPGSEPENGTAALKAPGTEETEEASGAEETAAGGTMDYAAVDNIQRKSGSSAAVSLSGTYETKEDYIAALNEPFRWVSYDAASGEVTITSLADFSKALKTASKSLGAFDQLDAGQGENTLFGYGDGSGAHFDPVLAELVKGTEYEEAFAADLQKTDDLGNTVAVRVDMYNPMYYLSDYYPGAGSSTPASFWRIRTGINQGDTALCTEADLALAVENLGAGYAVDFETVWGQGHTEAERTGSSTENFIAWVNACEGN